MVLAYEQIGLRPTFRDELQLWTAGPLYIEK